MKSAVLFALFLTSPAWAASETLSFEQALGRILERSTQVQAQQANLKATEAADVPAKLFYLPTFSLTGRKGVSQIQQQRDSGIQAQLEARLNIFRFGSDIGGYRAAHSEESRQTELLRAEILQVEDDGVGALIAQIRAQRQIEVFGQILKTQSELLSIARQRFNRGLLAQQEVDKLAVDLENARSKLVDAQVAESAARAALGALIGDAEVKPEWPWIAWLGSPPAQELLSRELSLDDIPAYRAAVARVQAEEGRRVQRVGLIFPSLDLLGTYGYSQGEFGGGAAGQVGWTGELAMTIPLFDRLQAYSSARSQGYVEDAALADQEATARNARGEWQGSRETFRVALASAQARQKILGTSRALYQDNLRRFKAGRINANDLSNDESRLFDSELLSVQGWSGAHLAFAKLCHSLGRTVQNCLQK
jgi:outer membrane protein TolC